jgi:hypothetical protein
MIRISNQHSINEIVYRNIERVIPLDLNPNRIITPLGNNIILVTANNTIYIFDVDGKLLRSNFM